MAKLFVLATRHFVLNESGAVLSGPFRTFAEAERAAENMQREQRAIAKRARSELK